VSFAEPDRIGTLRKASNQSAATSMRDAMKSQGANNPYAVVYEDTAVKGRTAVIWGGTGGIFEGGDPQAQIDAFFGATKGQLGGGTLGARQKVDPGTVGGTMECGKVTGLPYAMTVCAWTGYDALLAIMLGGLPLDKSQDRLHAILQAVVVKS
jgi:hypothetical protein